MAPRMPYILFAVVLAAVPAAAVAGGAPSSLGCEFIPVSSSIVPVPTTPLAGPCEGIRPGARMDSPSGCTYNFVYADQIGRLYIGTAGHCVSSVGQRVSAAGIGAFGTVVYAVAADVGTDFALIAIDADKYPRVTPAMCHWGGPTAADPLTAELGEGVKQYGHGIVLGASTETRYRQGALATWHADAWRALLPVTNGDSGSPLIFADGRAAGVVTHISITVSLPGDPVSTASNAAGTRLSRGLALAEAATGLDLTLLTAPLAA